MRSHCPRSCLRTVIKRRFKNFDPELFCNDLSMVPFDVAYIFDDANDICWAWSTLVSGVLDVHVPIKRSTVKREHVPYMTPELLDAIRRRNKLKRLYNKSKNSTDRVRYKIQRNFTSSLRRKLISGYLRTTAANARGNPRTFWRAIKPFMHCKSNTSQDVIHLKEDNTLITDKLEVSEVFNKYYSSALCVSDSSINRHTVVDYLSSNHQSISAIRTHCPVAQPFQFDMLLRLSLRLF